MLFHSNISISTRAGFLDDFRPFDRFGANVGGELLGRVADGLGALGGQALFNIRHMQNPYDLGMKLGDDRLRRAGGNHDAVPRNRLESRQGCFGNGRSEERRVGKECRL